MAKRQIIKGASTYRRTESTYMAEMLPADGEE